MVAIPLAIGGFYWGVAPILEKLNTTKKNLNIFY